jgi:hypothetical protein
VNIPHATLNIREHVPLKLWNTFNGLQHHMPVIFTPNNIQHIHMMANETLDWHLLNFLRVMDVHTCTPKKTATDCIVASTQPVQ